MAEQHQRPVFTQEVPVGTPLALFCEDSEALQVLCTAPYPPEARVVWEEALLVSDAA